MHLFNHGVSADQAKNPIWGFLIALNPLPRNAVWMAGEICRSRAGLGWCEDFRSPNLGFCLVFIVKVDALSGKASVKLYRHQGAVQTLSSTVTEAGVTLRRKVRCRPLTQFGL